MKHFYFRIRFTETWNRETSENDINICNHVYSVKHFWHPVLYFTEYLYDINHFCVFLFLSRIKVYQCGLFIFYCSDNESVKKQCGLIGTSCICNTSLIFANNRVFGSGENTFYQLPVLLTQGQYSFSSATGNRVDVMHPA